MPPSSDQAHIAGRVWGCEMTALEAAAEQLPGSSILWLDFDRFLAAPEERLAEVATFLELPADGNQLAEIARGPLMNRYSKALDYEFGPETRRRLLAEAAEKNGTAIEAALAMVNQAAEKAPLLARAFSRSTSDR